MGYILATPQLHLHYDPASFGYSYFYEDLFGYMLL